MQTLLQVSGLSKAYHKGGRLIRVLDRADFSIQTGEMVSVVGTSGAGKSTLLHLLGTLDRPDEGDVSYRGRDLFAMSSAELADFRNEELGFVFQFHHLLPEFSALENVMMPALIRRMARSEAEQRAEAVISEVGLKGRLEHKPGELSGGEQQRIALARALVLDPPLLLADEVTGNLDAKTGSGIHDLLFRLNEERQVTLVVVTHNRTLAESMPRQLRLEDGKVVDA